MVKQEESISWHTIDADSAFAHLTSQTEGLTQMEGDQRLADYGPNRLRHTRKRSAWALFVLQFHHLLIYVLLLSAVATTLTGHWVDAGVILGVVIVNAIIGFIQEGKAEKALTAIRDLMAPQATVLRDGKHIQILAEKLVPGDVVFVQAGDKVPADLRLFEIKGLRIDEASLTGESTPVEKSTIGDRNCMAFSGTLVTYGQGRGVVVATGDKSEIGKISALIALAPPMTTRLLLKIGEFSRRLTWAIGSMAAVTFAFGVFIRSYTIADMFLAAVGLAVAAIPEGLPAILTITLAISVQRMAQRNAIIRRLPSVETLGSVTVICSDKTGTLRRNEMSVKTVVTANELFEVTGSGYEPKGTFSVSGREFSCHLLHETEFSCSEYQDLIEISRASIVCNDASLYEAEGKWQIQGDPTEGSLIVLGAKAGLDRDEEIKKLPRLDTIPYDSEHRFMATLHTSIDGSGFIYSKGAPERILKACSYQRNSEGTSSVDTSFWHNHIQLIAARGQRPLAMAFKEAYKEQRQLNFDDMKDGLTMLGIVGIIDPPRGSAISAVRKCQSAGIRVKMITGDHVLTALAIGAEIGIGDGVTALTGQELDSLPDNRIRELINDVDVFARVSPEHKLRLVQALQANGEIVAMTKAMA